MKPDQPGNANRPATGNRPTTLPGNIGNGNPARPNPGNRPDIGETRPGGARPPNFDDRPGKPTRPARPDRPDNWKNVQNKSNNQWNQWNQKNNPTINNFQVNRTNNWNTINTRYRQPGWPRQYGTNDYYRWRGNVRSFRIGRGTEIWGQRRGAWDNCFDNHWWGTCWWRPRPIIPIGIAASPWWWWRPFAWTGVGIFFGSTVAPQPIIYNPGTTVIYEGDTYYVDGEPAGTATEAREEARELATPEVAEIPVPDPPMDGQPEEWLPVGVWALTQQEQGDATMFVQLSIDKEGLVAGAYKNIMTGDEQPIVGQLDKETQRVAWHVGETTQTVYETGLSELQNDVASVFVHFGTDQTQTWLLVRLPSPEIPPGTVTLPEIAKQ